MGSSICYHGNSHQYNKSYMYDVTRQEVIQLYYCNAKLCSAAFRTNEEALC